MDASQKTLWNSLDEETTRLSYALDLIYVMQEAAWHDSIDQRKLSAALFIVWQYIGDIEEQLLQLIEAAKGFSPNSSSSADLPQSATS